LAQELSDADDEPLNEVFRAGMALNLAAALGLEDLSLGCPGPDMSFVARYRPISD
jgi:hypothetical protein